MKRYLAVLLAGALAVTGLSAPANAEVGVYKIMPLGDSITRGVGQDYCSDTNKPGCIGYRARLRDHLVSGAVPNGFRYEWVGSQVAEPNADFVHEGHGGWTIGQIQANIDAWQATYRPDVILLHIGTNDVSRGDYTVAEIVEQLRVLLVTMRVNQPNVRIFVGKITDIATWADDTQELRNSQYANAIGQMVVNLGGSADKYYLVDFRSIGGEAIYDRVHPNRFGYIKMAYLWYEAMRGILPGSNYWTAVSNPWTWPSYEICHRTETTPRVCATQPVNDGIG